MTAVSVAEALQAMVEGSGKVPSAPVTVLVSGGGAHNGYLMERIRDRCGTGFAVTPAPEVDGKEAIGFALLGYVGPPRPIV
jgi:1,6-anhydro-N-acetylmuramate kinase